MNEAQEAKPEDEKLKPAARASFWSELKRRHVIRVASVYSVVAWLVIQVAGTTFESFGIPLWAFRFVVLMLVLGLPVSLVIAWALELTPEGIKRVGAVRQPEPDTVESVKHNKKRRWLSMGFAAALPTLIFGTLAVIFYLRQGDGPSVDPAAPPASEVQSIAVLPLVNMSDIDANVFFASGVHEDILTNLSRIKGLRVVSRTSVMRFFNSELSLRDIGATLGVTYIVEGSVRRIDNHVRVTVQLIDARNDVHLWANNYDRELVDVFATQSAVAREISNSLQLEIQPESVGTLEGMPTHSVKAYDLYLKARSIDRSEPESEAALMRQQEYLEEALQEDPDFVEAWAVLNELYDLIIQSVISTGWFVPEGDDRTQIVEGFFNKSVRALKKAVALDPQNMETLIARAAGYVGEEHLKEGPSGDNSALRRKMMDLILEKYPDSAMAWYISGWWYYLNANDVEAAREAFKKALELDPLHARIVEGCWQFFQIAADEEMVAMLYDRLTQIAPEMSDEQHLGQVSLSRKLSALVFEFAFTADQSLIERMAALLSSKEFDELDSITKLEMSSRVLTIQNDLDGLARLPLASLLQEDDFIDRDTPWYIFHAYVQLLDELLRQDRSEDPDKAEHTAELILQRLEAIPLKFKGGHFDTLMATACITLGQEDKAWALINKLVNRQEYAGHIDQLPGYAQLAMLAPDRAAERILEARQAYPAWIGMDYIAVYHLYWRPLLIHPDIQAYYVKEGKWIDYLAERVPEYEQYRK